MGFGEPFLPWGIKATQNVPIMHTHEIFGDTERSLQVMVIALNMCNLCSRSRSELAHTCSRTFRLGEFRLDRKRSCKATLGSLPALGKISTIFGPRSGPMDGTENLNGKLAKSSRNLGRKLQEKSSTQTVANLCGKSETRNGSLDNPKELWKPTGNRWKTTTTQEIQSRPHKTGRRETCTKNGNLAN